MALTPDDFQSNISALFKTHATTGLVSRAITYTPAGGSAQSIRAHVNESPKLMEDYDDGSGLKRVVEITLSLADVASPSPNGDKFVHDGDTFAVEEVEMILANGTARIAGLSYEGKEKMARPMRNRRN